MLDESSKADWLSFVLHLIVGLVPGCIIGYLLITRRRQGIWLQEDLIFPFLIGTSLFCGGVAARYGDRLWIGYNYRVIAPDESKHNRLSLFISYLIVAVGLALVLSSLFKHFS